MSEFYVVVRITREVQVTVKAEDETSAVETAIAIAKTSKSAHDIVVCDVEAVVKRPPASEQSAA